MLTVFLTLILYRIKPTVQLSRVNLSQTNLRIREQCRHDLYIALITSQHKVADTI